MNRILTLLLLSLLLLTSASADLEGFQLLEDQEYYYLQFTNHTIAQVDYTSGAVNWMVSHGASRYQMLSDGRLYVRQTSTGDVFIYEPDGTLTLQTWNSDDNPYLSTINQQTGFESVPYRTIIGSSPYSFPFTYFTQDGEYAVYSEYLASVGSINYFDLGFNAYYDRVMSGYVSGSTVGLTTLTQPKWVGNGSAGSTTYNDVAFDRVSTTTALADRAYVLLDPSAGVGGVSMSTQLRALDIDDDGGTPSTLWTITFPASSGAIDVEVWGANQNRILVLGAAQSTTYPAITGVANYGVYSRDGTALAGASLVANLAHGNTYYTDAHENDYGDMMFVEVRELDNNVVRILPAFGNVRTHTFDESVASIDVMKRSDQIRSGYQYGMLRFASLPTWVYEYYEDPTFEMPEYYTLDFIDVDSRYMEITISDVTLNNVPVEFLFGSGIVNPSTRFAIEAHYPEYVSGFNTSVFTSQGESNTTILPFSNQTDYENFYEVVFEFDMTNTDSVENYSEMKIEFSDDITGGVSDTFLIRRYDAGDEPASSSFFPSSGDATGRNAKDGVYVYHEVGSGNGFVKLVSETSTAQSATNIELIRLRLFFDRSSLSNVAKVQARLEVERSSTLDTVASSIWTPTFVFKRLFDGSTWNQEANVTNITITQNTTNTQSQASMNIYTYDKPSFGTWFDSDVASDAKRSEAYILEGGSNTIRTYSALSVSNSVLDDAVTNYQDWTIQVNLDNAIILGVPPSGTFDPTPTQPTDGGVAGEEAGWLRPLTGFSLAQSTFIYTVGVILLTWLIIVGYSIYVSNLTGSTWVTTIGVVIAAITSIMWVFVAVFIGWLPVWVVVLMIILGAGIATAMFRSTFLSA